MALLQLHWQRRDEPEKTEFVEQSFDINNDADFHRWWDGIVRKYKDEAERKASDGWTPMVCGVDSEHFVRAASPTPGDAGYGPVAAQ